jgi:membrane protein implicated in regulation of membrane protease activity
LKNKKYTAYSIITTLLEELALVAVVLWLLPKWGINIPIWGLILMVAALGAYASIAYWLGKKALDKKPIISPDVGSKCRATMPLNPKGYVRVNGELWQARASSAINAGEEVVIVGIDKMTLLVRPAKNESEELGCNESRSPKVAERSRI